MAWPSRASTRLDLARPRDTGALGALRQRVTVDPAGAATQPLFNPPPAEKRASLAAFDAAASHYQGVVLESLRNTADLLVALDHDARVLEELTSADEAARAALTSVQRQYALGSVGYREVLAAGQQAQQVRVALVSARAKQLLDAVALHQAVGGTTATPRDDEPTPKEEPR